MPHSERLFGTPWWERSGYSGDDCAKHRPPVVAHICVGCLAEKRLLLVALLAVAKAMDATSINDDGYTDGLGRVDEAMDALSATHPTWREWQP